MTTLHRKILAATIVTFHPLIAGALVIDDFSVPDGTPRFVVHYQYPETPSYVDTMAGSMITGERDFGFDFLDGIQPATFVRELGHYSDRYGWGMNLYGVGERVGGDIVRADMTLQYDGVGDEPNSGLGYQLNNVGFGSPGFLPSNCGGIRIFGRSHGGRLGIGLGVVLRAQGNVVAEQFITTPSDFGDTYFLFPFEPAKLAAADSLSIVARMTIISQAGDGIDINRIDTIVPEPTTIVAFAGATLWMLARSRRGAG